MNNNILNYAKFWTGMGIPVIPIQPKEKRPCSLRLRSTGDTRKDMWGNTKGSWDRFKSNVPDDNRLKTWFGKGQPNLGIVTGNRLVVIDFDDMTAFNDHFRKNSMIPTRVHLTSRGVHMFYWVKEKLGHTIKLPGIDIKATGYVVAPPSIHPSGKRYIEANDGPITQIDSINDIINIPDSIRIESHGPMRATSPVFGRRREVQIIDYFPNAHSTGEDYMMDLCPFHNDGKPSFWINVRTNRCGCHTCKNGSMGPTDFFMEYHNLTFLEAREIIENGTTLPNRKGVQNNLQVLRA